MDPDRYPTPTALLARTREVHQVQRAAEAELLQLAAAWADAHPDPDEQPPTPCRPSPTLGLRDPAGPESRPGYDPDLDPLVPAMAWSAGAAFAAAVGMSTAAGEGLIRDALTLRHRLPAVWARVVAVEVPVWRARRIAQAVHTRPADVADYLDQHLAAVAHRVGMLTVDRLIDEAMLRLHAEERELAQLEALDATHATLHEGSLTETGIGEMTLRADWKALHDLDLTLSEVAHRLDPSHAQEPFAARRARAIAILADPAHAAALLTAPDSTDSTDGVSAPRGAGRTGFPRARRGIHLVVHTTPDTFTGGNEVARLETPTGGAGRAVLAQQVATWCGQPGQHITITEVIDLTTPVTVDRYEVGDRLRTRMRLTTPTCVFPWCTRPTRACDADHTTPYNKGGPTTDTNLAPLCRHHHRLKTHTPWTYRTLDTGTWLWTDPHGLEYLRNHNGTRDLNRVHAA